MDLHPPTSPIRSIREYLIHLSTVVVGILIALGLEGAIDAHHGHMLAARAVRDMVTEIRANRGQVQLAISALQKAQPDLEKLREQQKRAAVQSSKRDAEAAQPPDQQRNMDFPVLSSAAWDSALAMQAVGRMDAGTAQKLSLAYSQQRDVKDAQKRFIETAMHFQSYGDRPFNDTPERMMDRLGAIEELSLGLISLIASYQELLGEYDSILQSS